MVGSYGDILREAATESGEIAAHANDGSTARDVFLARQPILDRELRTFGYELLYRDGPEATGVYASDDPDLATTSVMQRAVLDWGMSRLIGDRFGFINASPQFVVNGLHRALPPEGIILELRSDADYDAPTLDALATAQRAGYHFALDNVRCARELRSTPALPVVSMVKIEVSRTDGDDLGEMVQWVRAERPGALVVAEKVETAADYQLAFDADVDLFEGYFFARPEVLRRAFRPSNVAAAVSLLTELQRPDVAVDRIEELVGSDPSLAYRLLAVVNSSAFGLDRRVDSLRHAIVLLGISQVRHLAALIALSSASDIAEELITTGAARARLASTVAPEEHRSGAFTVGLLSVLDALYRVPMDELLEDLPVSADIRDALLDGSGPYAPFLEVVLACEQADVARLVDLVPGRIDELQDAYSAAVQWADAIRGQVAGGRSRVALPRLPGGRVGAGVG